ncbi:hypothetical protein TgHK011_005992 [Trichoderma gracile]|nr:hypothetical protein TgHK011_005992 [Trichoderma gracile]
MATSLQTAAGSRKRRRPGAPANDSAPPQIMPRTPRTRQTAHCTGRPRLPSGSPARGHEAGPRSPACGGATVRRTHCRHRVPAAPPPKRGSRSLAPAAFGTFSLSSSTIAPAKPPSWANQRRGNASPFCSDWRRLPEGGCQRVPWCRSFCAFSGALHCPSAGCLSLQRLRAPKQRSGSPQRCASPPGASPSLLPPSTKYYSDSTSGTYGGTS